LQADAATNHNEFLGKLGEIRTLQEEIGRLKKHEQDEVRRIRCLYDSSQQLVAKLRRDIQHLTTQVNQDTDTIKQLNGRLGSLQQQIAQLQQLKGQLL
jgi:chromosome segregation ATPase